MNVGLLLLRIVVGGLFIGHGTQKLFGWFGGGGLSGTGGFFQSVGFRPGRPMAVLGGLAESGGGLLLAAGFLTPLGAAAIIGMMTGASGALHVRNGIWNTSGGVELPLVYAASAATLAFVGSGRYSLDSAFGWDLAGIAWGLVAIGLGVGAGLVALAWRKAQLDRASTMPDDHAPPPEA